MEKYKQIIISNEIWEELKKYCKETGRSQKGFVEFLIKEAIKKSK